MANTTSAPVGVGADPGWNNVTIGGNLTKNFVYLGDGWALSARHVGPDAGLLNQTLTFPTGTFAIDQAQNFVVKNPATVLNSSGQPVNLSTPSGGLETDLRLVRLVGDPGLPSIAIAEQSAPLGAEVTFIGHGRTRASNLTEWNSSWLPVPANPGPVTYTGYYSLNPDPTPAGNDDTKRWGKNNIASPTNYHNPNAFFEIVSASTGIVSSKGGTIPNPVFRNVISLSTSFDSAGLTNEAQALSGDSGSGVFYKQPGGQWELAGIVSSIFTFTGQPAVTAVYGDATVIADLSYYNRPYSGSICDIMRTCDNYSIAGDVNVDGFVSGDGSGTTQTDDVAAFVSGWNYNNGSGSGDYLSWTKGDLNLDGATNIQDFILLRAAINGPMSSGALAALGMGNNSVPEPSAVVLSLVAAPFLFAGMRRRRRRS